MGQIIADLSAQYGFRIAAGIDVKTQEQRDFPLCSSYALCQQEADAVIDFSRAAHLPQTLDFAVTRRLPLVIGTTGLETAHVRLIDEAAQCIPILQSANFSLGMQVLKKLCQLAAQHLEGFDIEIIERHHAAKADAPGGTALMLYEAVAQPDSRPIFGRNAALQKRQKQEIGLHSLRGGTLCGTHETGFYGVEEHLRIIHTAESRAVFAHGALKAAKWLIGKPAGRYDLSDI